MVADVPVELIDTALTVGPPGLKANVAPRTFVPVTWAFGNTTLNRADFGQTELMMGSAITTKLLDEVTVWSWTVTEIGPVVAPAGTVATSVVVVAEVTVATVPLNLTVSEEGVALKPWPRIVTEAPTGPSWGLKSKMASCPWVIVERLI